MTLKNKILTHSNTFSEYGIGKATLKKLYQKVGLNLRANEIFLKNKQKNKIFKHLNKNLKGKVLLNRVHEFENFYRKVKIDKSRNRY